MGVLTRRATVLLVWVIAMLGGAGSAGAAPGALSQPAGAGGCISEDGTGGQCTHGYGLSDSAAAAISPDGRNLYVISSQGQSLAVFARDAQSGGLTEMGCFGAQAPTVTDPCVQVSRGLSSPTALTVSGDGRSVYVANSIGELTVFARDSASGALTQPPGQDCITSVGYSCQSYGMALEGASGVAVTPDVIGANVYVAAGNDQAIAEFQRDGVTSRLTQPAGNAACVSRNGTATSATGTAADCLIAPDGFVNPRSLAVSSDGGHVYVTDSQAHALWDFGRASGTGVLSYPACYGPDSPCAISHGITDARAVAVSPDGKAVYVTSATPGSIAVLTPSPSGGLSQPALAPDPGAVYDCYNNDGSGGCVQGRALAGARALALSPDGTNVYVSALSSGAIAEFARDPETNRLQQLSGPDGCLSYNGSGGVCTPGRLLEGLVSIVASPDGRNLYGVSSNHSAVMVITREQPSASGTPVPTPSSDVGGPATGSGGPSGATFGPPRAGALIVSRFAITIRSHGRHRPLRGILRFTLSRAASVHVSVWRVLRTHRSRGRCRRSHRRLATGQICSSPKMIGVLRRAAAAGPTIVAFASRIGTAKLRTGTYVARLVATGSEGLASQPVTATFAITSR